MLDASTTRATPILAALLSLVAAHRPAFRQERPYQRCLALVLGQVCALGRHTLTQVLLALGLSQADWSGFYRLLSRPRLDYEQLVSRFLVETLFAVPPTQPYCVALDGVQFPRSSQRMVGTSWLKAPRTPPWKPGIHRAQRFVHLAWLPPANALGYSRAIPLRLDPALPAKAVRPAEQPAQKEWEVGLAQLGWLRRCLTGHGRADQRILAVADSVYGPAAMWSALPAGVTLLTRCARNRALYALPPACPTRGRPRKYGARAVAPSEWLHVRQGWQQTTVQVRGRAITLTYRSAGPYLVKPAATQPLYLLVVKGVERRTGAVREPTYWLVAAEQDAAGAWVLPCPAPVLLAAAWQRWEVEVAHREAKTGFGVGEAQCWSAVSALLAVQWQMWSYAVVVLAGYRVWGLAPPGAQQSSRWWRGSRRWTLGQIQQALRQELWDLGEFQPVWAWTAPNWTEMEAELTRQTNAVLAIRRG